MNEKYKEELTEKENKIQELENKQIIFNQVINEQQEEIEWYKKVISKILEIPYHEKCNIDINK